MKQAPRPRKTWLLVARVFAGQFALVSFIGYLWFLTDELTPLEHAYFGFTFVALVIYAVVPTRILVPFRFLIVGISVVAIALSLPQMLQDLTAPGGADYFAVALRFIVCGLLALMSIESLRATREAV
jgi:hypothetical protein